MMEPREPKNDVDRFDSYDGMDNYRSSSDYK